MKEKKRFNGVDPDVSMALKSSKSSDFFSVSAWRIRFAGVKRRGIKSNYQKISF